MEGTRHEPRAAAVPDNLENSVDMSQVSTFFRVSPRFLRLKSNKARANPKLASAATVEPTVRGLCVELVCKHIRSCLQTYLEIKILSSKTSSQASDKFSKRAGRNTTRNHLVGVSMGTIRSVRVCLKIRSAQNPLTKTQAASRRGASGSQTRSVMRS